MFRIKNGVRGLTVRVQEHKIIPIHYGSGRNLIRLFILLTDAIFQLIFILLKNSWFSFCKKHIFEIIGQ